MHQNYNEKCTHKSNLRYKRLGFGVLFLALSMLILSNLPQAFSSQMVELTSADDAYVVSDLNDPADRAGLQNLNTGELEFMKIWYAWNVTQSGKEKIVSLGYMKYDLSKIKAEFIESAKLQMYANIANLTGAARAVDVYHAPNNNWDENALIYSTASAFIPTSNSSAVISKAGKYYTWDLTELVKKNAGSELSLVIALRTMYENSEEQVIFYSKDAKDKSKVPTLLIDYSGSIPDELVKLSTDDSNDTGMMLYGLIAAASGAGAFGFFMYNRQRNGHSIQVVNAEEKRCPQCGEETMLGYNVCPYCGTNLKQ